MKDKILIAGQEGMVGSSIFRLFKKKKLNVIPCKRDDLDFTDKISVEKWFVKNKPDIIINAAGRVGGILDNKNYQSDYIYINSMIGLNIVNSSLKFKVKKIINLGSACIYPKVTKQPINETYLLNSKLEETNEGYALAKILTLKYCQYLKRKFKKDFISVMPSNLYGKGDNFDLNTSHVLPALVKKFVIAKKKGLKNVEVWGSGNVKREFLNVEDLSSAIYFLLKKKINYDYINIGSGEHYSIREISKFIKKIVGYNGKILFNKHYPDGVKKRKLNSSKINKLGWRSKIKLVEGLKEYTKYYINEIYPKEIK